MTRVVISRIAVVTSLGNGLASLWQNLLKGKSGIAPLTRFGTENYFSSLAACIQDLKAQNDGSLLDSILERLVKQIGPLPRDTRLLTATTKGEIDLLTAASRQEEAIPSTIVFESLLAKIARRLDLHDAGCNINAACASSTIAVGRAAGLISAGQAQSVLVYAADVVSEFVFSGFSVLRALSDEPCRPFDKERKGLTLGEAGVALLLMSEERATSSGEIPLAYVSGWGAANDAHHVTAPARDGSGLIRACSQAINKGNISAGQVAAIHAHGTGTVYNDAMELTAFNNLFGARLPLLFGVKGSLGHCLGAAGGVEIAIACLALQEQLIPGTVGCKKPEGAGQGRLSDRPQKISGDYLLCCNSGFGGINGVVILQGVFS